MAFKSFSKSITEVVIDGQTYQTAISLSNNIKLAKQFEMEFYDIISKPTTEQVPIMLKYMVDGGFKMLKKDNIFKDKPDTFWFDLIDENPTLFGDVIASYNDAYAKYYNIQEVGNEEAVEKTA